MINGGARVFFISSLCHCAGNMHVYTWMSMHALSARFDVSRSRSKPASGEHHN